MEETKKINLEEMKNDPRYELIKALVGEAAKDFLLLVHKTHDVFDAIPHEFVNFAAIGNKDGTSKTLYTLRIEAKPDVTEEEFNRFVEQGQLEESKLDKKWSDKDA